MAPGARCKFVAPIFEREVFRKQMYSTVLKNVRVTLLGLFGAPAVFQLPQSDLAPG